MVKMLITALITAAIVVIPGSLVALAAYKLARKPVMRLYGHLLRKEVAYGC